MIRWITFPYVEVDYECNRTGDGVTDVARSTTLRLKVDAMRVLAERAAILSPALLLPHPSERNPEGVRYLDTTVPALIGDGVTRSEPALTTPACASDGIGGERRIASARPRESTRLAAATTEVAASWGTMG